jgi:high-affinity nickel permease
MDLGPDISTFAVLVAGLLLGLTHAVEADHLAAVTAVVSEKTSLVRASLIGAFWGLGHTLSLLLVGSLVVLLKVQISESTEALLEAIVGVMLILLGANAARKIFSSEKVHVHTHEHDGRVHAHFHAHGEDASPKHSHHALSIKSVLIGMVHGLAGSSALMLLILPAIESRSLALGYIVIFGLGSILGMVSMSLLIGLPFRFTADRLSGLSKAIRLAAAGFSVCLGVLIVYQKLGIAA